MDGFAVQSQDTIEAREDRLVGLRLAGRVPMGWLPEISISSGQAAEMDQRQATIRPCRSELCP